MRDERRRLNLSFAMDSERQRTAWEALSAIPRGQRTEAVCGMICGYMTQAEMLSVIRKTIKDELRKGMLSPSWPEQRNTQREQTGDVGDDVLGFLSALQEEGE